MRKEEKAPYYLLVHTNSYTGNFERELVGYALGILDEVQEDIGYGQSFIKAFWNSIADSTVSNLEEYQKSVVRAASEDAIDILKALDGIEDADGNFDEVLEKRKASLKKERYDNDIARLYDTYLCYTYQVVDDWEQDTFYNIGSFYKNKEYHCDTVLIQLNKPLPEKIEKIVIDRIRDFFENDIYNIINDYDFICLYGHGSGGNKEQFKLLDLELIDKNNNLVKKYV